MIVITCWHGIKMLIAGRSLVDYEATRSPQLFGRYLFANGGRGGDIVGCPSAFKRASQGE